MAASTTYLERYVAGECEPVWAELQALGAAVREEPLYADALAVARETMRRARANIEVLIPRLRTAGYDFGYGWLAAEAEWEAQQRPPLTPADLREVMGMDVSDEILQEMVEHDRDDLAWKVAYARQEHPTLIPPAPDVHEHLAELERLGGSIPLSLYAWYEQVGAVNFIGTAPAAWEAFPALLPPASHEAYALYRAQRHTSGSMRESSSDTYAYSVRPLPPQRKGGGAGADVSKEAGSDEATSDAHPNERPQVVMTYKLDPLFVYPLDHALRVAGFQSSSHAHRKMYHVEIAPDEYFKYFVSGGRPYAIRIPDAGADAPLVWEWHETTFVNYLRICFRWAGLPGLERRVMRSEVSALAALTRDLLPI